MASFFARDGFACFQRIWLDPILSFFTPASFVGILIIFVATLIIMDLAELKAEIQIALDKSDDTQLLEVVLALLHINTKPEIFDRGKDGSLGEQRKAVFEAGRPREQLANAIKKKILENLEK